MPRIRTIKPGFWSHPVMRRLSDTAQLMALALLNLLSELSLSGWVKIVDQPTRGRLVVNFEKHGPQDCDHPL